MKVLSLFSGVDGLNLGPGYDTVAFVEIDKQCRSVLARHHPDVPIYEDVTTFSGKELNGTVDVVVGGSPCQDLSVAGRREGLGGRRSGLFWEQCRIAQECDARWVVWENVAGALTSHKGADFALVLYGLTGFQPEVPKRGWKNTGVCVGPDRVAVWRVLDAQWFGVAQRRKRLFVVAGPRAGGVVEVLLERESVCRDPAPSRPEGSHASALTANGVGAGGGPDDNSAQANHLIPAYWDGGQLSDTIDVSMAVKGQMMPDKRRMFAVMQPFVKLHRAASDTDYENWAERELAPTVNAFDQGDSRATTVVLGAFDSTWSGRYDMKTDDVSPTVKVGTTANIASPPAVATEVVVRRLTPRECERLMGWPDDWTRFGADGKEMSDSTRYKMCGNGVATPVAHWIGQRLAHVDSVLATPPSVAR